MEIVAEKAFNVMKRQLMSWISSLQIFKYRSVFIDHWHRIDLSKFAITVDLTEITKFRERVIASTEAKLEANHQIYDYTECILD